ncbi:MAG: galactokinase [Bacteroidetes bacterium]|nr:galactokinase [Bacteroidota bacterium]
MKLDELTKEFIKLYGQSGEEIFTFFAPGRVNLIGEHTDYNNGYVLPCAISFGTYLLARKNNGNTLRLSTSNFEYSADISLAELSNKHEEQWVNYPLGVIQQFYKRGKAIGGLDLYFSGNIPAGAGLSSSASIELVTAVALNELYECGFDMPELIDLSREAEHEFIGVQCGIMDQFIVGKGRRDAALFLNCATRKFVHVPFAKGKYRLLIADTKKIRKLSDSKYNERVAECQQGLRIIQKTRHISSLGELSLETFHEIEHIIEDPVIRKRLKHVVSENRRVLDAVKALMNNKFEEFGKLMNLSHDSLRDDYEVTGFELDTMVEISRKQQGVLGSRMTGAGFGGCTVSLVESDSIENFIKNVEAEYLDKTGLKPEFYLPEIVGGAGKVSSS